MTLEDRTCLVTGSSRGIGQEIAVELGRAGANVAVNYRSSLEDAEGTVAEVEAAGGDAAAVQADVSNLDEVEAMADEVADIYGNVDVLVNNAGITIDKKFENMTRDDWDQVLDVNLGGMFNCTKTWFEDIRQAEEGRLINISSVVGQEGNIGQANYATTKSGMFGFTRTIALELAREGSTANCVAPGFVKTDMLSKVPEHVQQNILERIPLDRFAEVEDVAGIVRFVASEEASYLTGQVLGVNGGMEW
jgi:3-oxoacyl-[acyl-carrier protein] reductase